MIDLDGSFEYSNIVVIQPRAAESFTVYPNPAQAVVYLSGEYLDGWQLDIYNAMGQQVRRYAPISESVLDVHDLDMGIYMLHFTKDDIEQTVRLSVVH